MSFPRAAFKRFNENKTSGPPPGHYSVVEQNHIPGVIKFEKHGQRFKEGEQDNSSAPIEFIAPPPSSACPSLKKKPTAAKENNPLERKDSVKRGSTPQGTPSKDRSKNDREIRQLLSQCNERENELNQRKKEFERLENKLSNVTKIKTTLENQVTAAEKTIAALRKKVDGLEAREAKEAGKGGINMELKKVKTQLTISKQHIERDRLKMINFETDLQAAKSRISSLTKANKDLEKLNNEIQKHGDDVSAQVLKLHALTDSLRVENQSFHGDFETSNNKLKLLEAEFEEKLRIEVERNVAECRNKTEQANTDREIMKKNLETLKTETNSLEVELCLANTEKNRLATENEVLKEEISVLENNKKTLTETGSEMNSKLEEQNTTCSSLQNQIQKLTEELETANNNCERSEKATKECEETINELQLKYDEELKKSEQLYNGIRSQNSRNTDLENKISDLTTINAESQQKVADLMEALRSMCTDKEAINMQLKDREEDYKKLLYSNQELNKQLEQSQEEAMLVEAKYDTLETQFVSTSNVLQDAQLKVDAKETQIEELQQVLATERSNHQDKLNEFTRRILETQKKVNQKNDEISSANENLAIVNRENEALKSKRKFTSDETTIENERLKKVNAELRQEIYDLKKIEESQDKEDWKHLYKELLEKVKPFQSQLDAYSNEKALLLDETQAAQAEMNQLGRKYADLLGHQNQKQKIKHIVKIKEENITIKQENLKLRNQVNALQKKLLENRKPKFQPGKAFSSQKENAAPFKSTN